MLTTMKQAEVEVQNTLAILVVVINNTNSEIQAKQLQRKRISNQKLLAWFALLSTGIIYCVFRNQNQILSHKDTNHTGKINHLS